MMRLAANVSLLYAEHPFTERFALARGAGVSAVEFHWHRDVDPADIRAAVRDSGVEVVLMNFDGGDLAAGDRGLLADPGRADEFRANVPVALELAAQVDCPRLHALVGKRVPGVGLKEQMSLARSMLAWAADAAAAVGRDVLVEALNTDDNGPCLISSTAGADDLIRATGRDNLYLQFDVYHMHLMGEDIAASLTRYSPRIAHVQVADDPGRGEPGSGSIDFAEALRTLERVGYEHWIGLEYVPSDGDTAASLDRLWRRGWASRL